MQTETDMSSELKIHVEKDTEMQNPTSGKTSVFSVLFFFLSPESHVFLNRRVVFPLRRHV